MDIVDKLRAMGGYLDYDCEVTLSSIADEIQTLRAKVASAEVLVEALRKALNLQDKHYGDCTSLHVTMITWARDTKIKITTYDKLSEVKHDTE